MTGPGRDAKLPASRAGFAQRINRAWGRAHDQLLWVGRTLLDAKRALKHGEFMAMVEQDLPFGIRTADRLMKVAADERLQNWTTLSNLPASYSTLAILSGLDDATLKAAIDGGHVHADMTHQEAERLRREATRKEKLAKVEEIAAGSAPAASPEPPAGEAAGSTHERMLESLAPEGESVASVEAPPDARPAEVAIADRSPIPGAIPGRAALPSRKYAVIYADPPWRFETWDKGSKQTRGPGMHYPTMTAEEIADLPVGDLAAGHAVLLLWVTGPYLGRAFELIRAWGFDYKADFVWTKRKAGTGYWRRERHETLLLATRGNPPCPLMGEQRDSVFDGCAPAEPGRHSSKPVEAREMIEAYFPGVRRLELFARAPEDGSPLPGDGLWDVWGNQAQPVPGWPRESGEGPAEAAWRDGREGEPPSADPVVLGVDLAAGPDITAHLLYDTETGEVIAATDGCGGPGATECENGDDLSTGRAALIARCETANGRLSYARTRLDPASPTAVDIVAWQSRAHGVIGGCRESRDDLDIGHLRRCVWEGEALVTRTARELATAAAGGEGGPPAPELPADDSDDRANEAFKEAVASMPAEEEEDLQYIPPQFRRTS